MGGGEYQFLIYAYIFSYFQCFIMKLCNTLNIFTLLYLAFFHKTFYFYTGSLQYVSLSNQSSITSVTLEQGSAVNEALASHRDSLWSPSHSYNSSTAAATAALNSSASPLINKSMI